jgi:hypothetical protein
LLSERRLKNLTGSIFKKFVSRKVINPTILIELFLDQNFWQQKINPTILIELFLDQNFWQQKINPTILIELFFEIRNLEGPKLTLPFW